MSTPLQTRRDWLVGKSLAKPGRGKFSNAAKLALAKADSEGFEFLDGPSPIGNGKGPIKSTLPKPAKVSVEKRESAGIVDYVFPSDFRFPEGEYVAKDATGKRYGMRECCNNCRVSLTNHGCDAPSVHGNIAVTIVRR